MAHTPPKKEKERPTLLAYIMRDWYVYAVLLIALFALLFTWNQQLTIEEEIRAEYEDYIKECHIKCGGGIEWNITLKPVSSTPSADSLHSSEPESLLTPS